MGVSKATLPFGDEVLLQRVVRLLGDLVDSIVVVAAQDQALPDLPSTVMVVHDERPDRGPLEGIRSGLQAVGEDVEAVFVTACDTPFIKGAFVNHLFDSLAGYQVVVPKEDRFYHPLAAIYRRDVLATVEQLLNEDQLRPSSLFQAVATREIPIDLLRDVDPQLSTLRNLNHPEQYQQALRDARFSK